MEVKMVRGKGGDHELYLNPKRTERMKRTRRETWVGGMLLLVISPRRIQASLERTRTFGGGEGEKSLFLSVASRWRRAFYKLLLRTSLANDPRLRESSSV